MSTKLKGIGLGLLAMLATSAFAVMNATAETGGHFVLSASHTTLIGEEGGTHRTRIGSDGGTPIECTKTSYSGTVTGTSTTELSLAPHFTECRTESEPAGEHKVTVNMYGCIYRFTVGNKVEGHNTIHLVCPQNVTGMHINHPNCTIRLPPQTFNSGAAYTTDTFGGAHSLTVDVTAAGMESQYEGGICIFLGTKHSSTMTGGFTLRGESGGNPSGITAIG